MLIGVDYMNLFSDKTFEKESGKKLIKLIRDVIFGIQKDKNFCFEKIVTYENFENIICDFLLDAMKTFLENYKIEDKCMVHIKKLPIEMKGLFLGNKKCDNLLIINEYVIKELYDGDLEQFIALFHELNHFKVKYDIRLSETNEDIVRIIKERLIRESSQDPFDEIDSSKWIKKGYMYVNDNYYRDNYELYSEEVYVGLRAQEDFLFMLKTLTKNTNIQTEIVKYFQHEHQNSFDRNIKKYNNHERDFTANLKFNNFFLSYEEAFDLLIKDNPEWLKYPQISIEYYIDNNGVVHKRNELELIELFNSTENLQEKEYLKFLIVKNETKDNKKKI